MRVHEQKPNCIGSTWKYHQVRFQLNVVFKESTNALEKKMLRQGKKLAECPSDKGLLCKMYKELKKSGPEKSKAQSINDPLWGMHTSQMKCKRQILYEKMFNVIGHLKNPN